MSPCPPPPGCSRSLLSGGRHARPERSSFDGGSMPLMPLSLERFHGPWGPVIKRILYHNFQPENRTREESKSRIRGFSVPHRGGAGIPPGQVGLRKGGPTANTAHTANSSPATQGSCGFVSSLRGFSSRSGRRVWRLPPGNPLPGGSTPRTISERFVPDLRAKAARLVRWSAHVRGFAPSQDRGA